MGFGNLPFVLFGGEFSVAIHSGRRFKRGKREGRAGAKRRFGVQ
jgi:hypothetical protein